MKRQMLIMVIISLLFSNCYGEPKADLSDYNEYKISENQYKFTNNWEVLTKDGAELFLYYKTKKIQNYQVISDALYVLKMHDNSIIKLGGFDIKNGFFDSNGQSIAKRKSVDTEQKFWKKSLKGFSITTVLENPFFIAGIALNDKNELYETEVLEMLEIDVSTMQLKEWYPVW